MLLLGVGQGAPEPGFFTRRRRTCTPSVPFAAKGHSDGEDRPQPRKPHKRDECAPRTCSPLLTSCPCPGRRSGRKEGGGRALSWGMDGRYEVSRCRPAHVGGSPVCSPVTLPERKAPGFHGAGIHPHELGRSRNPQQPDTPATGTPASLHAEPFAGPPACAVGPALPEGRTHPLGLCILSGFQVCGPEAEPEAQDPVDFRVTGPGTSGPSA